MKKLISLENEDFCDNSALFTPWTGDLNCAKWRNDGNILKINDTSAISYRTRECLLQLVSSCQPMLTPCRSATVFMPTSIAEFWIRQLIVNDATGVQLPFVAHLLACMPYLDTLHLLNICYVKSKDIVSFCSTALQNKNNDQEFLLREFKLSTISTTSENLPPVNYSPLRKLFDSMPFLESVEISFNFPEEPISLLDVNANSNIIIPIRILNMRDQQLDCQSCHQIINGCDKLCFLQKVDISQNDVGDGASDLHHHGKNLLDLQVSYLSLIFFIIFGYILFQLNLIKPCTSAQFFHGVLSLRSSLKGGDSHFSPILSSLHCHMQTTGPNPATIVL